MVISTLRSCGTAVAGVFDDDLALKGSLVLGVYVEGPCEALAAKSGGCAVIAVGNNQTRRKITERFRSKLNWATAVHASSYVHDTVTIQNGTVVFAGAIVQPETAIGAHCIINTGATVDHDCTIGDYAHLSPGVHLAGGITIGEGAFLGIGSSVIQGIRIGRNAVVGAGAVVIRDVPDGVTVAGVPARALRAR